MARLIDDIRALGRLRKPALVSDKNVTKWAEHAGALWEGLEHLNLPVLLLDNVADYYFASEQEYWGFDQDFPNMAPPYPFFWGEYHLPAKIHSSDMGDTPVPVIHGRVGVLVSAIPASELGPPDEEHRGLEWALQCEIFIDYGRNNIQGPHGTVFLAIDKEGAIRGTPSMYTYCAPEDKPVAISLITWVHPVMLAVCFLHCKNVVLEDQEMPKPLAKKFKAKHGLEPTKYKTLIIEPLKKILRTQGRSGEVGLAKAMHICRGHFKDYREGRGLFGKYHQLVWTPSIVRGTRGEKAPPREIKVKL